MNGWGLAWLDEAIRLDKENRELRRILTALLLWIAEREELLAFARAAIARRWTEAKERDA